METGLRSTSTSRALVVCFLVVFTAIGTHYALRTRLAAVVAILIVIPWWAWDPIVVLWEQALFAQRTCVSCCDCHARLAIVSFCNNSIPVLVSSSECSVESWFIAYKCGETSKLACETFVGKSCSEILGKGTSDWGNRVTRALRIGWTLGAGAWIKCCVEPVSAPWRSYVGCDRWSVHVIRNWVAVYWACNRVESRSACSSLTKVRRRTLVSCLALSTSRLASSGIGILTRKYISDKWAVKS